MRQGRCFLAHFELSPHDKHAIAWKLFSENLVEIDISISNRPAEIRDSGPSSDFRNLKVLDFQVWPTVGCARSGLSSARRISAVRHTYDRLATFLWTSGKGQLEKPLKCYLSTEAFQTLRTIHLPESPIFNNSYLTMLQTDFMVLLTCWESACAWCASHTHTCQTMAWLELTYISLEFYRSTLAKLLIWGSFFHKIPFA